MFSSSLPLYRHTQWNSSLALQLSQDSMPYHVMQPLAISRFLEVTSTSVCSVNGGTAQIVSAWAWHSASVSPLFWVLRGVQIICTQAVVTLSDLEVGTRTSSNIPQIRGLPNSTHRRPVSLSSMWIPYLRRVRSFIHPFCKFCAQYRNRRRVLHLIKIIFEDSLSRSSWRTWRDRFTWLEDRWRRDTRRRHPRSCKWSKIKQGGGRTSDL